jgi:molecular chaperone GrpE
MFVFDGDNTTFQYQEEPPARRIPVRVVDDSMEQSAISSAGGTSSGAPEPPERTDWKELALRLQAEMSNFRKRQEQRVEEAGALEKERLLRRFLSVADNLRRALAVDSAKADESERTALREGVQLTYHELRRLLESEGVREIEAFGHPFTPELHEAVATVSDPARSGLVVEVVEPGYMLNDRLLRPARVVVAA